MTITTRLRAKYIFSPYSKSPLFSELIFMLPELTTNICQIYASAVNCFTQTCRFKKIEFKLRNIKKYSSCQPEQVYGYLTFFFKSTSLSTITITSKIQTTKNKIINLLSQHHPRRKQQNRRYI